MRLSKDLIGKPIITIEDGRLLGKVKDVYLDGGFESIVGLNLGSEGMIRRKQVVVPHDAVKVYGVDAILVNDVSAMTDNKTLEEAKNWVLRNTIAKREVDTPGGTKIGQIGDVILDEEANVIGFHLSKVSIEGPLAESKSIMRDAIIDMGTDGVMTIDLTAAEQANF